MVSGERPVSSVELLELLVEVPEGETVRFVPIPAPPPPVPVAPAPGASSEHADGAATGWREAQPVAAGPSRRRRRRSGQSDRVPVPAQPDQVQVQPERVQAQPERGPSEPERGPQRAAGRPGRRPKRFRRLRGILFWSVRGVLVGIAGAIAVPGLLGFHPLTVLSGSMEPAIHTGDVVVAQEISALEARIGDVVVFRDPDDQRILITHRVRAIRVASGVVHFTTKGDANNTVERWTVPADGSVGLVRFDVRRLGFALVWGSSRAGRLMLLVLPALLIGAHELLRIWRPQSGGRRRARAT